MAKRCFTMPHDVRRNSIQNETPVAWCDVVFPDKNWEQGLYQQRPIPFLFRHDSNGVPEIVRHRSTSDARRLAKQIAIIISAVFAVLAIAALVIRANSSVPGFAGSPIPAVALIAGFLVGWLCVLLITVPAVLATTPTSVVAMPIVRLASASPAQIVCGEGESHTDLSATLRTVSLWIRRDKSRASALYQIQVLSGPAVLYCHTCAADPTEAAKRFATATGIALERFRFIWGNGPSVAEMNAHARLS